jgi:glycosyltransferase involved in cell wall biosynthesis
LTDQPSNFTRKPRVSIGMPVYNREKYVGASIEAHLNQTYSDFELVITDNASTDGSEQICRAYAAKDPRVKYYRNSQNLGASGNYNRCFELSTGEYFRWTPSDDLVSPNLLERAVEVLDGDPSVFVAYPKTKLIDGEGKIIGDFDEGLHLMHERPSERWKGVQRNLRLGNLHYGLNRADQFRKTGLLRNYSGGDFPLIAEMSLFEKFYEIPDAFFFRRMHEAATSALKNSADVMAFYDPRKRDKLFLYNWVHLGANLRSIARAPIPFSEKFCVYAFEGRQIIWNRNVYFSELTAAATYAARKLIHSSSNS